VPTLYGIQPHIQFLYVPFYYYLFYIRSFKLLFPFGFPTKILCSFLVSSLSATCTFHLILLDPVIIIITCWSVHIMKLIIMQFSPCSYYFPFPPWNILISTLLSNTKITKNRSLGNRFPARVSIQWSPICYERRKNKVVAACLLIYYRSICPRDWGHHEDPQPAEIRYLYLPNTSWYPLPPHVQCFIILYKLHLFVNY
jgi:hypothetical protein